MEEEMSEISKRKIHLSPSILSADFGILKDQLGILEACQMQEIHIDVMDGQFVPPISFGMPVIRSIRRQSGLIFDVHLMVDEPIRFVDEMKKAGADVLTVHQEACTHLDRTLALIRDTGMKAGIALNPATPLDVLDYVYDKLDRILIMTVNPGYGGQSYLPPMTEKIRRLRKLLDDRGRGELPIEVDGGINERTIRMAVDAGAEILVAGSAVFKGNIKENIRKLESLLQD